jgi:small basic protein
VKGLLAADLLKLRKRWLLWVLLAVLVVLMAMTGFVLLVLPKVAPSAIPELPVFGRSDAYLLGAQQAISQTWFPLILAVVFLGSEVTTPIWATAVTQESRRWMHLLSKLFVLGLASWLAMLLAIAGWTVLATFVTTGPGLAGSVWAGLLWKSLLTQFTWVALGLGAVSLVRNTGISIGIALAFSFFEGIGSIWKPYRQISLTTASTSLFGNLGADLSGGFGMAFSATVSFTHAVVVVIGWTVVGMALAVAGLHFKDP